MISFMINKYYTHLLFNSAKGVPATRLRNVKRQWASLSDHLRRPKLTSATQIVPRGPSFLVRMISVSCIPLSPKIKLGLLSHSSSWETFAWTSTVWIPTFRTAKSPASLGWHEPIFWALLARAKLCRDEHTGARYVTVCVAISTSRAKN
jgi:hypothetical protein